MCGIRLPNAGFQLVFRRLLGRWRTISNLEIPIEKCNKKEARRPFLFLFGFVDFVLFGRFVVFGDAFMINYDTVHFGGYS